MWGYDASTPEKLKSLRRIVSKHIIANLNLFMPRKFPFLCFLAAINGGLTLLESVVGMKIPFLPSVFIWG